MTTSPSPPNPVRPRAESRGPAPSGLSPRSATRGALQLVGLRKTYGNHDAVAGLDLDIAPGEFFTLLGPSGCGKTTTLMMLAGFVEPTAGTVRIDGRDVADVRPEDREIGVVFQNYALFPHLTVAENLAFPLQMRRLPAREIRERVDRVLDLVQLGGEAGKYPAALSGGQQQRVAVARAIVFDPPVLLMDEPLGALDRKLRVRLQTELRQLQRELGVTVVYVTHDQDEAMSMSDRIAVMQAGRVAQVGTPRELYESPSSLFVADFLGRNNALPAVSAGPGKARLQSGHVLDTATHDVPDGAPCTVVVRPERTRLVATGGIPARVTDAVFLGATTEYVLDVTGLGILRSVVLHDGATPDPAVGDSVEVLLNPSDVRVFADPS